MASTREAAVSALFDTLARSIPGSIVEREVDFPEVVGEGGHIVVRDGDVGEPDVTLGIKSYWWRHRVDVEVYTIETATLTRMQTCDDLLRAVDSALDADRTIGGAVSYADWQVSQIEDVSEDGAQTVRAALVTVTLQYQTQTPMN